MKKFTLVLLLLGLSACGQGATDPGMSGRWHAEAAGRTIGLSVHDAAGSVTGTADLNFDWNTTERHFTLQGTADRSSATLQLLSAGGVQTYTLTCHRQSTWNCTLYAETGNEQSLPGTAISAARAWNFQLNAVQ